MTFIFSKIKNFAKYTMCKSNLAMVRTIAGSLQILLGTYFLLFPVDIITGLLGGALFWGSILIATGAIQLLSVAFNLNIKQKGYVFFVSFNTFFLWFLVVLIFTSADSGLSIIELFLAFVSSWILIRTSG